MTEDDNKFYNLACLMYKRGYSPDRTVKIISAFFYLLTSDNKKKMIKQLSRFISEFTPELRNEPPDTKKL